VRLQPAAFGHLVGHEKRIPVRCRVLRKNALKLRNCGQLSAKALLLTMLRRHYQGLAHLKRGDLWRWIKRAA
jgi:hypothetical protein